MLYMFYNDSELDKVLKEIGKRAKPSFKRFKYTEILAEGTELILGRYKSVIFIISEQEVGNPIEKFEIKIVHLEHGEQFSFGKYKYNQLIEIDTVFDENLFYNLFPAFFAELTIAKLTVRDCMQTKDYVMNKSIEIREFLKETTLNYEDYAVTLAQKRDSFFVTYSDFISKANKAEVAISNAKFFSSKIGNFMFEEVSRLEFELLEVKKYSENFEKVLKELENRLNLVYLQIEVERRKNELELNRRTSAITAAAVVIEFVAVAYYSLKIWESYLPVEKIPKILSFLLLIFFTISVIILTESIGNYLLERKKGQLKVSIILLVISLSLMVILPIIYTQI